MKDSAIKQIMFKNKQNLMNNLIWRKNVFNVHLCTIFSDFLAPITLNILKLTVIHANDKATRLAKFRVQMVKAPHAERFTFSHDIPLAS